MRKMDWRVAAAAVSVFTGLSVEAQTPASPDVLPRFHSSLKETLRRLPDYTCIETITRSRRGARETHSQPLDTIRLRVGLIGGQERYSWPDAAKFDDRELRDLVGRGIIGTGNFADHVRHVFLSSAAVFKPLGTAEYDGRPVERFEFEVPVEYSRYKLRVAPDEAEVGIRGSFRVDSETMDLLTFEVQADEIPPELGLSRMKERIAYGKVAIGDTPFLLAKSSDLTIVTLDGEEYRNQISFADCHQFRADSKLVSEAGEAAASIEAPTPARSVLPVSMMVELALDSDIDPAKAAVGDSIRAILTRPLRDSIRVIAPEGSVVHGRLVRVERSPQPFDHFIVGLAFHTLESGQTPFDFLARCRMPRPRCFAPGETGGSGLHGRSGRRGWTFWCERSREAKASFN